MEHKKGQDRITTSGSPRKQPEVQPTFEPPENRDVGSLLSVPQAAARLGVKPATIRSWILRREKIEVVRIGRCVRITERSLVALIESNLIKPEK